MHMYSCAEVDVDSNRQLQAVRHNLAAELSGCLRCHKCVYGFDCIVIVVQDWILDGKSRRDRAKAKAAAAARVVDLALPGVLQCMLHLAPAQAPSGTRASAQCTQADGAGC